MKLVRINELNNRWEIVEQFLTNCGESLKTFRYFFKRGKEVLYEHIHTVVLYEDEKIIGYGHLDTCDSGKIWLGICLISGKTGLGLGKLIMNNLLQWSDKNNSKEINLSVDISNAAGKKLYEHFDFRVYNKTETMYFMKRSKRV